MKTVGIIGGLGPETTAKFYLELVSLCQKKDTIKLPSILIYSVPILYEQIYTEIKTGACAAEVCKLLVEAAKILENGSADFIVMPCNSLHVFIDDIRSSVAIPVLSIVEETTKFLKNGDISRVGTLSTLVTRNNKLYDYSLANQKIEFVTPTESDQARLNQIILNLNLNQYDDRDKNKLVSVIDGFVVRGVRHVILACTDLQLLAPESSQVKIYDTMKILAAATVKEILKN